MPKFFCDYCDCYLTHDSPSVRKAHCSGRKHKDNVRSYYEGWMAEQAQELIDKTTRAFQQGQMVGGPQPMGPGGPMMRPPMGGPRPMMGGPPMVPMGGPRPMMGGPMPPHMMMRPAMQPRPAMMMGRPPMMSGPPRPPM